MKEAGSDDYCTRVVHDLGEVGADAWDSLLPHDSPGRLFVRHAFLSALQESGCVSPGTGWEPHFLTLWRGGRLCAGVPLYCKHHSYGEYVFDWAWADAHQRHGIAYYPKWLVAVPFTPVPGPRLLGVDAASRQRAAQALLEHTTASSLSSAHVLFPLEEDARTLGGLGALTRHSVQFHWFNRGYGTSRTICPISRSRSARRCARSAAGWRRRA